MDNSRSDEAVDEGHVPSMGCGDGSPALDKSPGGEAVSLKRKIFLGSGDCGVVMEDDKKPCTVEAAPKRIPLPRARPIYEPCESDQDCGAFSPPKNVDLATYRELLLKDSYWTAVLRKQRSSARRDYSRQYLSLRVPLPRLRLDEDSD